MTFSTYMLSIPGLYVGILLTSPACIMLPMTYSLAVTLVVEMQARGEVHLGGADGLEETDEPQQGGPPIAQRFSSDTAVAAIQVASSVSKDRCLAGTLSGLTCLATSQFGMCIGPLLYTAVYDALLNTAPGLSSLLAVACYVLGTLLILTIRT